MDDPKTETTNTDNPETVERSPEAKGWLRTSTGKTIAALTGAALLIGGAFGMQAIAESKAYRHMATFEGSWQHRDHKPLEEMTEAEIEQKVTRGVRHLGIELDATPEQEAAMIDIALGVVTEIRPLKERMHLTGQELKSLLTAPTVDRAALEALRASRLAEAERISKTLVDAVADLAEVLTPEQRGTIEQMIREKQERHEGRRHWRRRG